MRTSYAINETSLDYVDPHTWSLLIPAAGKGERLGFQRPKVLLPVLGKPLGTWIIDAVGKNVVKVIVVVASHAQDEIVAELAATCPVPLNTAIQERPIGMADAIALGMQQVKTPNVLVVWGDQATVCPRTLKAVMSHHQQFAPLALTLPTIQRRQPYISLQRSADGRVEGVWQARESKQQLDHGESDCGVFAFDTKTLLTVLAEARANLQGVGTQTKEFNLLPLVPLFELHHKGVHTIDVKDESQTVGINTPDEVAIVQKILAARSQQSW